MPLRKSKSLLTSRTRYPVPSNDSAMQWNMPSYWEGTCFIVEFHGKFTRLEGHVVHWIPVKWVVCRKIFFGDKINRLRGNVWVNQRGAPTCRRNLCSYFGYQKYLWIQGPWAIWFQLSMYHRGQGPPCNPGSRSSLSTLFSKRNTTFHGAFHSRMSVVMPRVCSASVLSNAWWN